MHGIAKQYNVGKPQIQTIWNKRAYYCRISKNGDIGRTALSTSPEVVNS